MPKSGYGAKGNDSAPRGCSIYGPRSRVPKDPPRESAMVRQLGAQHDEIRIIYLLRSMRNASELRDVGDRQAQDGQGCNHPLPFRMGFALINSGPKASRNPRKKEKGITLHPSALEASVYESSEPLRFRR